MKRIALQIERMDTVTKRTETFVSHKAPKLPRNGNVTLSWSVIDEPTLLVLCRRIRNKRHRRRTAKRFKRKGVHFLLSPVCEMTVTTFE